MARRREVRKKGACHESCYVFICMYDKKREKLCDFCCVETAMPELHQCVLEDIPLQTLSQGEAEIPNHA